MISSPDPLISIVVPAYNYGRFLGACLDGVLAQTYANWELIVVDNGSSDNTQEVLAGYSDPRIRKFRIEKNNGPVEAWALGYKECRGDYFALLPADDVFLPEKLEKQVAYLQAHPEINVVGTYIQEIDDEGKAPSKSSWIVAYTNQSIDFTKSENWHWKNYLCIPTALYSKSLCDRAKAVPWEGLNNICDWDFHVRLIGGGAKFAVIPEELTCYRCHGSNTSKKMIDSYSQWIYSHTYTYIPVLRKSNLDYLPEIQAAIEALYAAPRHCYFIDGVPKSRRCANLEILLNPEQGTNRFSSYQEFLHYSDHWVANTENRAAIAALDSSLMSLRARLLRDAPDKDIAARGDLFLLERSFCRLQQMEKSWSWLLTAPLRFFRNIIDDIIGYFRKSR